MPQAKAGEPLIILENVSKWFDSFQALKEVSLTVDAGAKVVVCGPSGSGKSTMIRCINRRTIEVAGTDGTIQLAGLALVDRRNTFKPTLLF